MEAPADRKVPTSIGEAVGGWLGIAESTLPFLVFTGVWAATGKDILMGGIAAVSLTAVLAAVRIARKQTVQYALSGVLGVAFGAFVANRTGKAEDFFLPGILINAVSATVYLLSILIRKPLLGLIVSTLTGGGRSWYEDPAERALYTKASWIWVGLFCFRLSIQLPLYLSGEVGPLAIARVITGLPLFALGLWLSYLILRPVIGPLGGDPKQGPDPDERDGEPSPTS